jgi:hypothetical protein
MSLELRRPENSRFPVAGGTPEPIADINADRQYPIMERGSRRHEGYWRRSQDEDSPLPWPIPDDLWTGRQSFISALGAVELVARQAVAAGFSRCRLCSDANGSAEFSCDEWSWPSGFRHYVDGHGIRPSAEFEAFIAGKARNLTSV